MKRIFVFNGIANSGKTTLAQAVSKASDRFSFFPEVGGMLRNEVTYSNLESGEEFDLEVLRRELRRDKQLIECDAVPIVETWHIGNAAYAMARNPDITGTFLQAIEMQMSEFEPIAVLLKISWPTFRSRATLADEPEFFFRKVLEGTLDLYERFGIKHMILDNDMPLNQAAALLTSVLDTLL